MTTTTNDQDIGLTSPDLILTMLRTAGYKNSSYALAELVDNSIDANASDITISIATEHVKVQRTVENISAIGVLDNGGGMDTATLKNCIRLGWGTNLEGAGGSTLGKFGFGLKGAALAFCKRLEVYSWQDGEPPRYTYLDYDERIKSRTNDLIDPVEKDPRDEWSQFVPEDLGASGTLVIWSKLDRLDQSRASTLLNQIDQDLCRIFRHFMDDDDTLGQKKNIQAVYFDPMGLEKDRKTLKANDPIYVLTPNTTPGFEHEATNEEVDRAEIKVVGPDNKQEHIIEAIYTIARPEIQKGESLNQNMGNTKLGQHYEMNEGISFVRAGREITLSKKNFFPTDPRNRWIGIEIRIPPALDEFFGITNDKQNVTAFKNYTAAQIQALEEEKSSEDQYTANRAKAQLDLHNSVTRFIKRAMDTVKKRGGGQRSGPKKTSTVPAGLGDDATPTKSATVASGKDNKTKLKELEESILIDEPEMDKEEAKKLASEVLDHRLNLYEAEWPGEMFLEVAFEGKAAVAKINRKHQFFLKFYDYLKGLNDERAIMALQAILIAYARAEDTLYNRIDDQQFEELRIRWGRYVNEYIDEFME